MNRFLKLRECVSFLCLMGYYGVVGGSPQLCALQKRPLCVFQGFDVTACQYSRESLDY